MQCRGVQALETCREAAENLVQPTAEARERVAVPARRGAASAAGVRAGGIGAAPSRAEAS